MISNRPPSLPGRGTAQEPMDTGGGTVIRSPSPYLGEEPISVLLINESVLIRDSLSDLMRMIGRNLRIDSLDSSSAAATSPPSQPDVILLSIKAPGAIEATLASEMGLLAKRYPGTPILVLSERDNLRDALKSIDLGSRGYFPDALSVTLLTAAIRLVAAGGLFMSPNLIMQCVAQMPH